jgi:hypothetical protein
VTLEMESEERTMPQMERTMVPQMERTTRQSEGERVAQKTGMESAMPE